MYLISAEGCKNAGVQILIIRKTGEIWASKKNVHYGLGVKNTYFKRNIWHLLNKKVYKKAK